MNYEPFPGRPRHEQLRCLHVRWALRKSTGGNPYSTLSVEPLEDNEDEDLPIRGQTRTVLKASVYPHGGERRHPWAAAVKTLKLPYLRMRAEKGLPLFPKKTP